MPIISDYHLHSSYSADSSEPMEQMVLAAIKKGLKQICFTEHMDLEYPYQENKKENRFEFNTDSYLYEILTLKEKYESSISINFGVELGLQKDIMRQNAIYAKSHDFDFIIASIHVCHKKDPYYPEFFEGRSEKDALTEYFQCVYENIRNFNSYDVLGHLDYVIRYSPNKDSNYSYQTYRDLIDTILNHLIENEKGLECNTGGLKSGLKDVHPCLDILKRYRELGGEIVTVGSDAHNAGQVGDSFDRACEVLKEAGFKYYTIFDGRMPEYLKL